MLFIPFIIPYNKLSVKGKKDNLYFFKSSLRFIASCSNNGHTGDIISSNTVMVKKIVQSFDPSSAWHIRWVKALLQVSPDEDGRYTWLETHPVEPIILAQKSSSYRLTIP